MRKSARTALANTVNDLTDALDPDSDVDEVAAMQEARERLSLLLERDAVYAERIQRYDAGASVKVKMSRGDSPRDQDQWTIEGKGETHMDAAQEFDALLEEYKNRWADDVREIDPYEDEE